MNKKKPKAGFTLIELSLSMVFISLLSLAIVLIIMNTISSYRRGLTMNLVNSTGEEIIDDIRVAIQNSSANSISNQCGARYLDDEDGRANCEKNGAGLLVSVAQDQTIKLEDETEAITVPVYGAICTGKYSYIWNSGYTFSDSASANGGGEIAKATLTITGGSSYSGFHLLKVSDEKRTICAQNVSKYPSDGKTVTINANFTISADEVGTEAPIELIEGGSDLALYDLNMLAPAESNDGTSLFYTGSMILGTLRGGPNIKSSDASCKAPDSAISDLDYCAINKFKFAVQANGA